jgi:hypothetical protein
MNWRQQRRILLPVALVFFSIQVARRAVARVMSKATGGAVALRTVVVRGAGNVHDHAWSHMVTVSIR